MGLNIDKLSLEVSATSDKAEKSIDKLINKLTALASVVNKTVGLGKIANHIERISVATAKITNTIALDKLTTSLAKLNSLQAPNVTKTVNAINKLVQASNAVGSMSNVEQLATNIQAITDACKPLETMGKNSFAPFLNSLKKIPEITNALDTQKITEFAERIKQITSALAPLTTAVSKSENGLIALNSVIRSTVANNGNLASSNATATRTFTSFGGAITTARLKMVAFVAIGYRLKSVLSGCLASSNEYVENLNLFTVSMGSAANEAFEYAETVNKALGIDISDWIRNQGVFKQITSGFGVITEKANLMSKNLTQIGYDISSFYNIDIEESMQKVQSGISGELEPLRRLGYALDAATLQQIAYNNGITQNINTMTQAQKSQLRYIAILQQSKNVMGDMARTIITPANSMRILGQQLTQLKRAIGNIVSVLAMKLIPYVQVAIRLLTDFANFLAEKMGFELPKIDYSGATDGISSVTDTADEATDAVNETVKAVQRLAGFDEINTLKSPDTDSSSGTGSEIGGFDLGVDLPEYDFLKGLDKQTDSLYKDIKKKLIDLYNWLKKHKELIKAIAKAVAGIFIFSKFAKLLGYVSEIWSVGKKILGIGGITTKVTGLTSALKVLKSGLVVAVSAVAGFFSIKDLFSKLYDGTLTWKGALLDVGVAIGAIAVGFAVGGPIGGAVVIVAELAGAFYAAAQHGKELSLIQTGLFQNDGVKITEITDAFSAQADQYVNTKKKLEEYSTSIETNKGTMATAVTEIDKISSSIANGKMSEDELNSLTSQYSAIADGIKNNLGLATTTIIDGFSDKMKTMSEDLGVDLDKVISDLQGMEVSLGDITTQADQTVANYYKKLYSGATITSQEQTEFENAQAYLFDCVKQASDEITAYQSAVESIDFSKIDMESLPVLEEQMRTLNDEYCNASIALDDIYTKQKRAADDVYANAEIAYKNHQISASQLKQYEKTHEEVCEALTANLEQSRKDLETDLSAITGAVKKAYDDWADELAESFAKTEVMNNPTNNLFNDEDFENWKKNYSQDWKDACNFQRETVDSMFGNIQDAIDIGTENLSIVPDESLGSELISYFYKYGKIDTYSAMKATQDSIDKSLSNIGISFKNFGADLNTNILPGLVNKTTCKATGASIPDNISAGVDSKSASLYQNVANLGNGIISSLNVDLTSVGQSVANSFVNGFSTVSPSIGKIYADFNTKLFSNNIGFGIKGYATGGMPQKSQLFMARENGIPEMVGKMGNQTAVANNGQIVEGIEAGVERGVMRAMAGNNSKSDVNVYAYIDSDEIATKVEERNKSKNIRAGGR